MTGNEDGPGIAIGWQRHGLLQCNAHGATARKVRVKPWETTPALYVRNLPWCDTLSQRAMFDRIHKAWPGRTIARDFPLHREDRDLPADQPGRHKNSERRSVVNTKISCCYETRHQRLFDNLVSYGVDTFPTSRVQRPERKETLSTNAELPSLQARMQTLMQYAFNCATSDYVLCSWGYEQVRMVAYLL